MIEEKQKRFWSAGSSPNSTQLASYKHTCCLQAHLKLFTSSQPISTAQHVQKHTKTDTYHISKGGIPKGSNPWRRDKKIKFLSVGTLLGKPNTCIGIRVQCLLQQSRSQGKIELCCENGLVLSVIVLIPPVTKKGMREALLSPRSTE